MTDAKPTIGITEAEQRTSAAAEQLAQVVQRFNQESHTTDTNGHDGRELQRSLNDNPMESFRIAAATLLARNSSIVPDEQTNS